MLSCDDIMPQKLYTNAAKSAADMRCDIGILGGWVAAPIRVIMGKHRLHRTRKKLKAHLQKEGFDL